MKKVNAKVKYIDESLRTTNKRRLKPVFEEYLWCWSRYNNSSQFLRMKPDVAVG
jgi:hypothetical protein